MNAHDSPHVNELARSLDLSPRQVVVVALQLAADERTNDDEQQRLAIAQVRVAPEASDAVAALLLTPIASFAQDDIDRALAQPLPAASRAEA